MLTYLHCLLPRACNMPRPDISRAENHFFSQRNPKKKKSPMGKDISGRWWRTGKPGMPQSMGSQRVRHDWATEQQWEKTIHMFTTGQYNTMRWGGGVHHSLTLECSYHSLLLRSLIAFSSTKCGTIKRNKFRST